MGDRLLCTYRWRFRNQHQANRAYAEAELRQPSGTNTVAYLLTVWLVRDEQNRPTDPDGKLVIDPEDRVGRRTYVGSIGPIDHRDERLRVLAHLSPLVGREIAYQLIHDCIKEAPTGGLMVEDPAGGPLA